MYDILAGKGNMETSYLMSKGKALEAFPMLKQGQKNKLRSTDQCACTE